MEHIDIKIRYSTGAYHASTKGKKVTASSSISAVLAGSALLRKVCPGAKVAEAKAINPGPETEPYVLRFSYVLGELDRS
ncbi:hypothetical protein [Pseudomonas protegens]|uniref:hypothetical protein n=1 Tax=Pseudomonas protegens TaxID=380021 RepID=UPI0011B222C7|nr:hypothetical protein [Pseudomonas protegens]